MGEYIEEGGIRKYSEDPLKEAVAWQGYNDFVGIDNYKTKILEEETVLVKMEPSGSGYFTTLEEVEKISDSRKISEGLQIAPREITFEELYNEILEEEAKKLKPELKENNRRDELEKFLKDFKVECIKNPEKLKDNYKLNKLKEFDFYKKEGYTFDKVTENNRKLKIYEYRPYIKQYKLTKKVEVAFGEKTEANKEYGKGGLSQIYIAGYDGWRTENNKAKDLLEELRTEKLNNVFLNENEYKDIMRKHNQHILKRNYFSHLCQKEKLINLRNTTDDIYVKSNCKNKLKEIDENIKKLKNKIGESIKLIGFVPSQTYDKNIGYLTNKIKIIENAQEYKEIDNKKEKDIFEINKNVLKKVSKEIELINNGVGDRTLENRNKRISIDELRKSYETYIFIGMEKNNQILRENKSKISKLNNKISEAKQNINKNDKILSEVKESHEKINKYQKIYEKYEKKKIFKNKFYEKNYCEINEYRNRRNYLLKNDFKSIENVRDKLNNSNEKWNNIVEEKTKEKESFQNENTKIEKRNKGFESQLREYKTILKEINKKEKGVKLIRKNRKEKELEMGR